MAIPIGEHTKVIFQGVTRSIDIDLSVSSSVNATRPMTDASASNVNVVAVKG